MHPLTPYKVFFPSEWDVLHRKVHDRVWLGLTPTTQIPLHLIDPVTKSLKSADFIEFKNSAKGILKQLERWQTPVRKMDAELGENIIIATTKQKKVVTIDDRSPAVGDRNGNHNYYDFRSDSSVKGANVLYTLEEERPLDDEERRRAGLVIENGKKVKVPPIPAKQLLEEPARCVDVEDTWSHQGFTYYGFMVGGRYNRFDTFDDVLFREYGIFLPKEHPGRVYFSDRLDEDEAMALRHQRTESSTTGDSSSMMTSDNETRGGRLSSGQTGGYTTTSSSDRLRFTIPMSLSTSDEPNTTTTSSSNRNRSGLTFGDTTTATTTTIPDSKASSAYYYEANAKSVKAFMDRVAGSMATTPRRSHGASYHHHAYNTHAPRTVVKGGRGGRSFSFSFRPRPAAQQQAGGAAAKTSATEQPRRNNPKIDQLISLGYQMATINGKGA